jgi:cell division topological specificity factor
MGLFNFRHKNTGTIAKDRLKLLLNAERINCSPSILVMLKNDLLKSVSKYIIVDETNVSVKYTATPPALTAHIPIQDTNIKNAKHTSNHKNGYGR